jgi:hypothetical protein
MALGGEDLEPALDLDRCLGQFGPGVCANGSQQWSNYEANHGSFYAFAPLRENDDAPPGKRIKRALPCTAKNRNGLGTLSEWAEYTIKPQYLTVERKSIKWDGQKYRLPPLTWTDTILWNDPLRLNLRPEEPPFKEYGVRKRTLGEPSWCVARHGAATPADSGAK